MPSGHSTSEVLQEPLAVGDFHLIDLCNGVVVSVAAGSRKRAEQMHHAAVVVVALRRKFLAVRPRLHGGGGHTANVTLKRSGEFFQPELQILKIPLRCAARLFQDEQFGKNLRHGLGRDGLVLGFVEPHCRCHARQIAGELDGFDQRGDGSREGDAERLQGLDGAGVFDGLLTSHACAQQISLAQLLRELVRGFDGGGFGAVGVETAFFARLVGNHDSRIAQRGKPTINGDGFASEGEFARPVFTLDRLS